MWKKNQKVWIVERARILLLNYEAQTSKRIKKEEIRTAQNSAEN